MTTTKWTPPKGWWWMPGMCHDASRNDRVIAVEPYYPDLDGDGDGCAGYIRVTRKQEYINEWEIGPGHDPFPYAPDFTDPATRGCLLELVREAWGDPGLSISGRYSHAGTTWHVVGGSHHGGRFNRMAAVAYPAEVEALLAALEAAP